MVSNRVRRHFDVNACGMSNVGQKLLVKAGIKRDHREQTDIQFSLFIAITRVTIFSIYRSVFVFPLNLYA